MVIITQTRGVGQAFAAQSSGFCAIVPGHNTQPQSRWSLQRRIFSKKEAGSLQTRSVGCASSKR